MNKNRSIYIQLIIYIILFIYSLNFTYKIYTSIVEVTNIATKLYNEEMNLSITNYEFINLYIKQGLIFEEKQILIIFISLILSFLINIILMYFVVKKYKKILI